MPLNSLTTPPSQMYTKKYSDTPLNSTIENHLPPCSRTTAESNLNPYKIGRGLIIGISDRASIGSKSFRGKAMKKRKLRFFSWCSNNHIWTRKNCKVRGGLKHCEHKNNY